jgi:hypothetical protein
MRHALQPSQIGRDENALPQREYMHIGESGHAGMGKKPMFRSTQLRFAAIALFATAAVSLTTASARAFGQDSGGAGGTENSTFADPDEQVNIFGYGGQGAEPSGLNGPVQFGSQQGQRTPFKHFQNNGLSSPPPDPLSRPSN